MNIIAAKSVTTTPIEFRPNKCCSSLMLYYDLSEISVILPVILSRSYIGFFTIVSFYPRLSELKVLSGYWRCGLVDPNGPKVYCRGPQIPGEEFGTKVSQGITRVLQSCGIRWKLRVVNLSWWQLCHHWLHHHKLQCHKSWPNWHQVKKKNAVIAIVDEIRNKM